MDKYEKDAASSLTINISWQDRVTRRGTFVAGAIQLTLFGVICVESIRSPNLWALRGFQDIVKRHSRLMIEMTMGTVSEDNKEFQDIEEKYLGLTIEATTGTVSGNKGISAVPLSTREFQIQRSGLTKGVRLIVERGGKGICK